MQVLVMSELERNLVKMKYRLSSTRFSVQESPR